MNRMLSDPLIADNGVPCKTRRPVSLGPKSSGRSFSASDLPTDITTYIIILYYIHYITRINIHDVYNNNNNNNTSVRHTTRTHTHTHRWAPKACTGRGTRRRRRII